MERRFVLRFEVWEDGKLIRSTEEARDQLDNDGCDGERTAGLLLSFIPGWFSADGVGGGGLATMAYACMYLPRTNADMELFRSLGRAYEEWGAAHNFADCVSVAVDSSKLECNACECDHACPHEDE